eukprot:5259826-Lingulodinium_polyedra.AAC.1
MRRAPKEQLVFTPARAFNEGALEIQIATRSGAGVAKGSPILIDYGPLSVFASGPEPGAALPDDAAENDRKIAEE